MVALFCIFTIQVTFLISFSTKLFDVRKFVTAIEDFQIIPKRYALLSAVITLTLEGSIVILLIFEGFWRIAGIGIAAGLLMSFSAMIAWTLHRNLSVSCNCFGSSKTTLNRYDLIRNIGLFIISLLGIGLASVAPVMSISTLTAALPILWMAIGFVIVWINLNRLITILV